MMVKIKNIPLEETLDKLEEEIKHRICIENLIEEEEDFEDEDVDEDK